ncbi:hypothetical protein ACFTZK_32615 [Streptomyces decoyicus]|uniref:hypothetical protein n=1 Tax=Streptomyces decoyicus TaxID=249567 RepID=UPI00363E9787
MSTHTQDAPLRHQDAYAVVVTESVDDIEQLNEFLHSNLPSCSSAISTRPDA